MPHKERFSPDIKEYWAYEHLHRYAIATSLVANKVVLDIASGEGYGTEIISRFAKTVIGVDSSIQSIEEAKRKYVRENLQFILGDIRHVPLPDKCCDVIVCFETLEHVSEHEIVFSEFKRLLKPEGILVISSPNKKYYSDINCYNNSYHKKELYENEFKNLTKKYFTNSRFYLQNTVMGSLITSEYSNGLCDYLNGDFNNFNKSPNYKIEPLFLMAICSDHQDVILKTSSIFQFTHVYDGMNLQQLIYEYSELQKRFDAIKESKSYKILHFIKRFFVRQSGS